MEAALASAERQIERLRSRERAHARALLEARHQLQEASSASSVISEDASLTPEAGAPARRPLQRGLMPPQSFATAVITAVANDVMEAAEFKPAQIRDRDGNRSFGHYVQRSCGAWEAGPQRYAGCVSNHLDTVLVPRPGCIWLHMQHQR